MSKRILVVGSINVDYVIHTDRLPVLGETIVGKDFSMNFGGKGANQAIALAKSGCEVRMLGAVGTDFPGRSALENLERSGVDCRAVARADAPTGAAVITVCGGDNHIILDPGANDTVTPAQIEAGKELFAWADLVVMQYEIPAASVLAAAVLAHAMGKTVLLNPAPMRKMPPELYANVDWIVPNETEAAALTGIEQKTDADAEAAVTALRGLGCRNAIVTLGGRGCAFSDGDEVRYGGIYPVRVADTTAAGDSFIGGFCSMLCTGAPVGEAVRYAAAVSAVTVSRPGAAVSIPTADEVALFLKSHRMERP